MDDFSKYQRFHHLYIGRIRDHVENRVTEQEFDLALDYLKDLKILLKDEWKTLQGDRSWLLREARINPNLIQQIDDLRKSVEDKKAEFTEALQQAERDEKKREQEELIEKLAFVLKQSSEGENKANKSIEKELPITDFKSLFKPEYSHLIEDCVNVLRKIDPRFLGEKRNVTGGLKGTLVVWIDELARKGWIKKVANRSCYSEVFRNEFQGFKISGDLFSKENPRASERYNFEIKRLLSQVSQKERKES